MSRGQRSRVDRVEAQLLPLQAIRRWLDEAHRYESLHGYMSALRGKSSASFPLFRLQEQVSVGAHQAAKGLRREVRALLVRQAVRDVVLLFLLVMQANRWVTEHERIFGLQVQLLLSQIRSQRAWEMDDDALAQWRDDAAATWVEPEAARQAIDTLSRDHFGGAAPVPRPGPESRILVQPCEERVTAGGRGGSGGFPRDRPR